MNILLATDGSESAAAAARLLARLPLPAEARVTVLSAAPEHNWIETPPPGGEATLYPWLADLTAEEEAAARQAAEAAAALLRERGGAVAVRVRRENPVPAILEQAEEDGAGLIVVGSHGKGAMERFLVGSVSERVARHAHCSVLVARGDQIRRVLVAFDGSESAEHALDALARLPLPAEAELRVLHVLPAGELAEPMALVPSLEYEKLVDRYEAERRAAAERLLQRARERLRAAGRAAETALRSGAPAEQIVTAARETGADLVVVGSANRSALGRLFLGSVSSRVLSHAPCSVLVARSA